MWAAQVSESQSFLDRKMELLKTQATTVQQAMAIKNQNLQGVVNIMNQKAYNSRKAASEAAS